MNRAVAYCRVSSDRQVENYSLDTQEAGIRAWCERNELEVVRVFREEGKSGRNLDREELKKLLTYCRRSEVDVVVVYKVSRIARDTLGHLQIKQLLGERGVALRSVLEPFDDTPPGKLMETVLASFSQFDNEVRAEQILTGMKAAAHEGRWVWPAPIGYVNNARNKSGPSLLPDPETAKSVKAAFERAATGMYSTPGIAEFLNREGYPSSTESRFYPQFVYKMLRKPIYRGELVVKKWGFRGRGDWEPLVDDETWLRVQRILDSESQCRDVAPRKRNSPDFPLRGLVRCARTGARLTGSFSRSKSGKRYAYYHTVQTKPALRVARGSLHEDLVDLLSELRPSRKLLSLWRVAVLEVLEERQDARSETRSRVEKKVGDLREQKKRLARAYATTASFDQATFEALMADLQKDLEAAELAAKERGADSLDIDEALDRAAWLISDGPSIWRSADLDGRQRFVQLVFPDGLEYVPERGFRTPTILNVFKHLRPIQEAKKPVVERRGFEPPTPTMRTWCSPS